MREMEIDKYFLFYSQQNSWKEVFFFSKTDLSSDTIIVSVWSIVENYELAVTKDMTVEREWAVEMGIFFTEFSQKRIMSFSRFFLATINRGHFGMMLFLLEKNKDEAVSYVPHIDYCSPLSKYLTFISSTVEHRISAFNCVAFVRFLKIQVLSR